MRQIHYAGDCVFVDYAGKTIAWTDPETGEAKNAQVFVGVLGCSNYTFAWASDSQKLEDWITAHVQMFQFFGGVPSTIVPDNLKSAVTSSGVIPQVNKSYSDLAKHYNCIVQPARVYRPQDKSLAELGVLFVTRWITVALKRQRLFSLTEVNEAIMKLLKKLNDRPFKRLQGSRQSQFLELDKPQLQSLPNERFEHAEWVREQKVGRDYHIYVKQHAYSVPYQLVGERVEARVSANTVEILHLNKRIASHIRSHKQGGFTTDRSHMPVSHRKYAERNFNQYKSWADGIGSAAKDAIYSQFAGKDEHSTSACKACDQLQKLERLYGRDKFETACERAKQLASLTVTSIHSILKRSKFDTEDQEPIQAQLPLHHNVRGANYYGSGVTNHA